jgi:Exopolysaccharide biosynthesis protein YbjH
MTLQSSTKAYKRLTELMVSLVLLLVWSECSSQRNLSGKPGYMNVPSAAEITDGLLCIGYNYNPIAYSLRNPAKRPEQILYANLVLLPNVDVTFSMLQMRENGKRVKQEALGDRQFDVRWRAIKEKKYRPAVALVMTNPFTIDAAMVTQAVVATKHFEIKKWLTAELTAGYGSNYYLFRDVLNSNNGNVFSKFTLQKKSVDRFKNSYLVGPLAGGKIAFKHIGGLMGEWDGLKWNGGGYVQLFKHLNLQAGMLKGDQWMFGASFQGNLNPKTKP